jgi:hypothetical protein
MIHPELKTGAVIRYPYLWVREGRKGETEGRKSRPVAVALRLGRGDGSDTIVFLPLTTTEPDATRFSVEVPEIEKKRGGLDLGKRIWLILDEFNTDLVGQSFYLESKPPIGKFSKAFIVPIVRGLIARRKSISIIDRRK